MFMRRIYDEKLAQAAYLIGCQKTGEAIVIDPQRDVDRYIDLAAENDLRITATAETHIHADFLSGSRELCERIGATAYLSGEGDEDWSYRWLDKKIGGGTYDHRLLRHDDSFSIGNIEFRTIHTPGHTPEHIAFLVTDHGSGADEPIGLATGDFVFVGDLGRPDLLESAAGKAGAMEPSARQLFRSVHTLDAIPEYVQVWPGHGAGSACGKALGAVPTSTVGYERRFNPAIKAASSEQGFVDFILAGQPEPPMYFANMKRDNRDGPALLGELPKPPRVDLQTLRGVDATAVAIADTRPWDEFRAGHVPGSLSFPLIRSFNTDAGSMIRDTQDIYLVIEEDRLEEAVRDLVRIGLDRLRGWCPASELARAEPDSLATIREVSVDEAVGRMESDRWGVLDVRRATEHAEGHIPGSTNIAHTRLMGRLDEVPNDTELLVHCRSGERSARATAFLQRAGYRVVNLRGGFLAWERAAATVET